MSLADILVSLPDHSPSAAGTAPLLVPSRPSPDGRSAMWSSASSAATQTTDEHVIGSDGGTPVAQTTAPPTTILSLPDDVWSVVLGYCSTRTAVNLMLTCRQLQRAVAAASLYWERVLDELYGDRCSVPGAACSPETPLEFLQRRLKADATRSVWPAYLQEHADMLQSWSQSHELLVLVVGAPGVGKRSFATRFCYHMFTESELEMSVFQGFYGMQHVDAGPCVLEFVPVPLAEAARALKTAAQSGPFVALFAYHDGDSDSYRQLESFLAAHMSTLPIPRLGPLRPGVLLALQSDYEDASRKRLRAARRAAEWGLAFAVASARTGAGVSAVVDLVVRQMRAVALRGAGHVREIGGGGNVRTPLCSGCTLL